jgi:hypothetical protein
MVKSFAAVCGLFLVMLTANGANASHMPSLAAAKAETNRPDAGHAQSSASTLSGVLKDSLGNAVTGAQITVGPADNLCHGTPVAQADTASDGSFNLVVSPGTYDVQVEYGGGANDPSFRICTQNVDLSASIDDTLTVPVTQLTVNVQDSNGNPVQGATVGNPDIDGVTAPFDLIPGDPIDYGYVTNNTAQTNAAGTAVVPLMPLDAPLILDVQPPSSVKPRPGHHQHRADDHQHHRHRHTRRTCHVERGASGSTCQGCLR